MAFATFGGGCFWCLQPIFDQVEGVLCTQVGYSGGTKEGADYKTVCAGETDHAEVVHLEFDPAKRTFSELVAIFLQIHDPTTLNRQGADVGRQYRSVIFYHSEEQQGEAKQEMEKLAKTLEDPIVTELSPFSVFYPAEEYHHDYYRRNPNEAYCQAVIGPKLAKYAHFFRKES